MKILIAGASGLIGSALVYHWRDTHELTLLGRKRSRMKRLENGNVKALEWSELDNTDAKNFDIMINLCGKNIAAKRWSEAVKKEIIDSRVNTTRALIQWAEKQQAQPHFFCANAVGIYGLQEEEDPELMDENKPVFNSVPKDFLQEVGQRWQEAAEEAIHAGIPLTVTRFGVVIKRGEGMLKKLTLPFYFGLGSVIGNGEQKISWIHLDDLVRAFDFLLDRRDKIKGPVNICAPNPVRQKDFARALAKVMHRPLFLKTPSGMIRLMFGEMGECLINSGQAVVPKRLLAADFTFNYPEIEQALSAEFKK